MTTLGGTGDEAAGPTSARDTRTGAITAEVYDATSTSAASGERNGLPPWGASAS